MDFDELFHRGVAHDEDPPGRGSGRYGWGTGENPGQHQFTFRSEVLSLKKKGISESEIAKMLLGSKGVDKNNKEIWSTSTDLRAAIAIADKKDRQINMERANRLLIECDGNVSEVARRLGRNESTIRGWLDPMKASRTSKYENTADMLKKAIEEKGIIDVSAGVEHYLGVTNTTKKVAIAMLEREGYVKTWIQVPQADPNHKTTIMVLAAPGTPKSEIQKNKFQVESIRTFTPDEGKTWWSPEFPESLDSKRIMIRYAEDGGKLKDGVIELRPGVEDISLGGSQYAQVRIAVDGTNYMKGMAIYSDDIPKGYDVVYNTNKKRGTPAIDKNAVYTVNDKGEGSWSGNEVLKRMKIDNKTMEVDRDNPFGALIKSEKEKDGVVMAGGQRHYIGSDGKEHLSPINKLQDEGDWDSWSRNLSSQFLSKQPLKLIKQQIDLSIKSKKAELDEILNLTNPVIKKKMLEDFSAHCDSDAASLSVKGVKNQAFQVLLPIPDMKDNEIYAPNYDDGDIVALVRYPHGGTFEIPILKVNNKHETAKSIMRDASDAVGINSNVAEQLSGADYDGDTALVIPIASNNLSINARKPIAALKDFDPKEIYKLPDSAPRIKHRTMQNEMGRVTNLITDMTVGGASIPEITRAVKHSMVVIDAEKHHLDYKKSAEDNNIAALKYRFQGVTEKGNLKGASTILSRASSTIQIPKRKEVTDVKKMTPEEVERWNRGYKIYHDTGETMTRLISDSSKMTPEELELFNSGRKVYRKTGELRTIEVYQMDTVDDARDLVRNRSNQKEMTYAEYANNLKDLGREARREARSIKPTPVSQSAKKAYATEVEDLNAALRRAQMNAPRERQAQLIANAITSEKFKSNPDMDYEHRQRERARALTEARAIVGAKKDKIVITDSQWDAIQANAISTNKLIQILNNTDQEAFKKRAMPKDLRGLTDAQIALAKSMLASGMYTQKEIADKFGVSASTVSSAVRL